MLNTDDQDYFLSSATDFSSRKVPYHLSFYQNPPLNGEIDKQKLEEYAVKRLAVLQLIDSKSGLPQGFSAIKDESVYKIIDQKLNEYGFKFNENEEELKEKRINYEQIDILSHYTLRLAFSVEREKQDWFIRQECRLFLFKLGYLLGWNNFSAKKNFEGNPYAIEIIKKFDKKSLKDNGYSEVSFSYDDLDKFMLSQDLHYRTIKEPHDNEESSWDLWTFATSFKDGVHPRKLYLVPAFPDASHLVRSRRVFVKDFLAYVPPSEMESVLLSKFRNSIVESFKLLLNREASIKKIFSDERIKNFLEALPSVHVGFDGNQTAPEEEDDKLSSLNIDKVWMSSFPPCMRYLYMNYRKEGYLKHWGRQQLWMFFKGAGMKLEDQLQFNRNIWQNKEKFDKEHRYNLRHMYGQEGRHANYSAYNCSKILGGCLPNPGAGDHHGCPFKHFDNASLKKHLLSWGMPGNSLHSIMEFQRTNEFQLACVRYFIETHSGSLGESVGNHPNSYYKASRRYYSRLATSSSVQQANSIESP